MVRTEFGRFRRQVSGYSLEHLLPENGCDVDRFLVGTEGTLAVVLGATVRLVEDAPAPGARRARLPVDGRGRRRRARRCCTHPLVACEGLDSRIVDVVRARRGPCPTCRAARAGCSSRSTGDTEAEAAAAARGVVADAGALDAPGRDRRRRAAALWRIREDGAGLAARSLDRPAQAGWEDAAVPPERLGAYLRDFDALLREHGLDGVPYGHFGDGCVHVRIDFDLLDRRRPAAVPRVPRGRRAAGRVVRRHAVGRARRRPGPLRAAAADVLAEALDLFAPVKGGLRPRQPAQPRRARRPAPARRRPPAGRSAARAAAQSPLRARRRRLADAVHRCTGVGKCLADNTGAAA